MARKSLQKTPKSPKTSRRRAEANQPATSSSSSDPSLASMAAERLEARRARSRSKSKSKAQKKAQASSATGARSRTVEDEAGSSEYDPRSLWARPDSPRTPPRSISPRRKTTPKKSPFKTKSPLKPTASATPPPVKKASKSLRGPSSNLLAEGRPGSFSGSFAKSIPFNKTLERIRHYASINVPEGQGTLTSLTPSRDRKAYVFVPNTDRINQRALGQMMSQLYGYLGTVQEEGSEQQRRRPSSDETGQSADESKESKELRVIDVRKQPIKEETRAERLAAEREAAEIEAAARQAIEPETEALVRVLSNLSAPSSSPEPKRASPKAAKCVFQYNPDLIARRHSTDASIGAPAARGGSSHVAPEFGKGKSRVKFVLRRIPDKTPQQKHKDSRPQTPIQMIELGPVPDSDLARRRLSRHEDPTAKGKDAAAAASSSQPGDEESRVAQDIGPPSEQARLAADSPQPGPSGYRQPRVSVESEEEHERNIEDLTTEPLTGTATPQPSLSSVVTQELPESARIPPRSEYDSTVTSTGNYSRPISTPEALTCDWRHCYRDFIACFNRRSATVADFVQHLSGTLVRRIREPGTRTRRYFLIAGLCIWMLVQDAANDYWFFCGGRQEEGAPGEPPRMMDPDRSVEYELGAEPTPPPPAPQRPTVRNICTEAARRVARGARTIRRRRASSREPQRTPEEIEANIQRLLALIRERHPTGPIEPRRDFTAADCPFISLNFHSDIPENPAEATEEAAGGEAIGEAAGGEAIGEAAGGEAFGEAAAAEEAAGAAQGEPQAGSPKLNVPAQDEADSDSEHDENPDLAG